MKQNGKIARWNDAKGFGFIETEAGESYFFHITAVKQEGERPEAGLEVSFTAEKDKQGRNRAGLVDLGTDSGLTGVNLPSSKALMIGVGVVFLLALYVLSALGYLPASTATSYLVMSGLTAAIYAFDKRQAQKSAHRVSEITLHSFAVLGGWPGAMIAQQVLRHKSSKAEFRKTFWLTVIANLVILALLLWLYGARTVTVVTSNSVF